jgi:SAM-dependent methyltransferase
MSTVPPSPSPAQAREPAAAWRRWPLPALGAWALAWLAFAGARAAGLGTLAAAAGAALLGVGLARAASSRMRAAIVAAGFPLSLLDGGAAAALPAWAWLAPLAALLLLYPARAWRDAPLFPTPAGALDALPQRLPLADGARVLDAGCGLGHGMRALRRAYPQARIDGIESSLPLAWWAGRRCRLARVRRGDLWARSWADYALVYLFQRPESMAPALAKARAEMAPGSWLASLAFAVPDTAADAVLRCPDGRLLWLYRAGPAAPRAGAAAPAGPTRTLGGRAEARAAAHSSRRPRRR